MTFVSATTELEAVNIMLTNIGESPVNTLENQDVVDAGIARGILASVNREVQSRGWWFNTDVDRVFNPNNSDHIQLGINTLRVDNSGANRRNKDYVQRGLKLYDRANHTFKITNPVTLTIVTGLSFDDLPETARRYITLRSSRIFQERMLGTPTVSAFNEKDEAYARSLLVSEDDECTDHNMLEDSRSVQLTLNRNSFLMR